MLDAGNDFFFAALLEVLVGGHEGGEADFGAYLADEGEAIGQGLAVHRGGVGVGAKVLDHGPEAVWDISRANLRRRALMRDLM